MTSVTKTDSSPFAVATINWALTVNTDHTKTPRPNLIEINDVTLLMIISAVPFLLFF